MYWCPWKVPAVTIFDSTFFCLVQLKERGAGFVKCTRGYFLRLLSITVKITIFNPKDQFQLKVADMGFVNCTMGWFLGLLNITVDMWI